MNEMTLTPIDVDAKEPAKGGNNRASNVEEAPSILNHLSDLLAKNTIIEEEENRFDLLKDVELEEGKKEGNKQENEQVGIEKQGEYNEKSKALWSKIDIFAPIAFALFTFVPSLYLLVQAGSYIKPMFSFWVLVSITTGEALGVVFELIRLWMKPKSIWRWDRTMNYLFSSLVALIYGVVLREKYIYWTRRWITTLLPFAGGLFKHSRQAKLSTEWTNFFGTVMLLIEVYRITLIGAVLEFSDYNWGLMMLLLPLLYVEMIWVSALCPCWLQYQHSVISMLVSYFNQEHGEHVVVS